MIMRSRKIGSRERYLFSPIALHKEEAEKEGT
jgi:hypothetical protein